MYLWHLLSFVMRAHRSPDFSLYSELFEHFDFGIIWQEPDLWSQLVTQVLFSPNNLLTHLYHEMGRALFNIDLLFDFMPLERLSYSEKLRHFHRWIIASLSWTYLGNSKSIFASSQTEAANLVNAVQYMPQQASSYLFWTVAKLLEVLVS